MKALGSYHWLFIVLCISVIGSFTVYYVLLSVMCTFPSRSPLVYIPQTPKTYEQNYFYSRLSYLAVMWHQAFISIHRVSKLVSQSLSHIAYIQTHIYYICLHMGIDKMLIIALHYIGIWCAKECVHYDQVLQRTLYILRKCIVFIKSKHLLLS